MPVITERIALRLAQAQQARALESLAVARERAGNGRRVRRVEDDPVAAARLMQLRQLDRQATWMGRLADELEADLGEQEQVVRDALVALAEARRAAVGARVPAIVIGGLSQYEVVVREQQAEILQLANAQGRDGHYLFAGTLDQAAPFVLAGTYSGNAKVNTLEVAPGMLLPRSFPGDVVFGAAGPTSALTALGDLATQIQNLGNAQLAGVQDPVADAGVGGGIDAIDAASRRLESALTEIGTRGRRLASGRAQRDQQAIQVEATRRRLGQDDVVEAAVAQQRAQDRYLAAQRSTAELMQVLRPG